MDSVDPDVRRRWQELAEEVRAHQFRFVVVSGKKRRQKRDVCRARKLGSRRFQSAVGRRTLDVKVPEAQDKGDRADTPVSERAAPSHPELESFRSALDAGRVGLWSWDLRSHQMTWSTKLEDFHGHREEMLEGTFSIAPEDLKSQDATGVLAAIGEALQTREP